MTKVYLSPSSQSDNRYAYGGVTEQQICNRIASATKTALERNGFEVRKAPEGQGYSANVKESNAWGSDVHMPIHTNAGGGDGTLMLAYPSSVNNKYVKAVYNAVAALSPGKDDGIKSSTGLYEINQSVGVCVYIECEFHDNSNLAKWIVEHTTDLGEAIAKGMCTAEGKTYKAASSSSSSGSNNNGGKLYRVQVGAFKEKANADKLVSDLKKKGFDAFITS